MKGTEIKALDLALQMEDLGVRRIIYTDIKRDGTLTEPGFEAVDEMVKSVKLPIIAAGGISKLRHLKKLAELGVEGAIVGKALYTGDINLKQALALRL
jgi:phosphoribosylformimino-5-aminoimidazole carboxamide ribotide isomerase